MSQLGTPNPRAAGRASATQSAQLLGAVERMNGSWETKQDDGSWKPSHTFATIAAGSVVRETMFAGSSHEMEDIYHMDGTSLVCTHFCAAGNQPRMRATQAITNPDGSVTIPFHFDSVTNLGSQSESYMGAMTLTIVDTNNARQEWQQLEHGRPKGEPMLFELHRVR